MIAEKKSLCPLCKLSVDEDDTWAPYRKDALYGIKHLYPEWAYVGSESSSGDNLVTHLINFHRLPIKFAEMFTTSVAIGGFLKDHPEFKVGLITEKVGAFGKLVKAD